ncbi:MAG: excinuclease ABC subunit UvrC [Actinomycetaceae bacterium]|nr:excinuclease ABC subunit UvrC [Actinomycetaceae bacterium]
MPDLSYRPRTADIPTDPGVYRFIDGNGQVIYVGKAKNLRQRLSSYFRDFASLHPRTQNMVSTAKQVQWTVVNNEVEALTLEYSWIKEYDPRFNVMYRDDKSYPYLAVTMGEEIPRMHIMRGARRKGTRYFGPYSQVWAIRETMEQLQRVFPMRTCSNGVLRRAQAQGRPCLLAHIGKCAAPCTGQISVEDHRQMAQDVCQFMAGKVGPYLREKRAEMRSAAADLEFEKAAQARDEIAALEKALEQNAVVLDDGTDADVFALVLDELEAAVHVFHVRGGRIRGVRGWVVDRRAGDDASDLMATLLQQVYSEADEGDPTASQRQRAVSVDDVEHTSTRAIPALVMVSHLPTQTEVLTSWLTQRRGAKVRIYQPQRGDKASLLKTVQANAEHSLRLHKSRRSADLTQRSKALEELTDFLGLDNPPLRIECYDVSHTQGTHQVASMVVFEDGAPRKRDYRHFTISPIDGKPADDTAAMNQVLTRRFLRLQEEESQIELKSGQVSGEQSIQRFSYRPSLVVVDGGRPQVEAARRALDAVGANVDVIGLAKRLEEVWLPGEAYPLILPRQSAALYLLQYLRDESHRFAISHHRKKRTAAQTSSFLDGVEGVGPARQKALLKKFGSLKRMRRASVEELATTPGIGPQLAQSLFDQLHDQAAD